MRIQINMKLKKYNVFIDFKITLNFIKFIEMKYTLGKNIWMLTECLKVIKIKDKSKLENKSHDYDLQHLNNKI